MGAFNSNWPIRFTWRRYTAAITRKTLACWLLKLIILSMPFMAYSHTVAFSHYNHISNTFRPENQWNGCWWCKEQAEQCLQNIKAIIRSVDHSMDDTVKIVFNLNVSDIERRWTRFTPHILLTLTYQQNGGWGFRDHECSNSNWCRRF